MFLPLFPWQHGNNGKYKMAPMRVALLLSFWFLMASTTLKDSVNPSVNACPSVQHLFFSRPAATQRRIFYLRRVLRREQANWTKHGYICYSLPDFHHSIDLTIHMGISPNPAWSGPLKDCLHVLYLNARSLKAFVPLPGYDTPTIKICKITIFQQLIHTDDFDIVCICETWLNQTVLDSEILPEYSIFRRDRGDRIGGTRGCPGFSSTRG